MKPDPVTVTLVPGGPLLGENDVISGAAAYVNVSSLVVVPPGVVTVTFPVAPSPTVTSIWVSFQTVKSSGVPPKSTSVAPHKLAP